jgi:hypothetical protein
MHTSYMKHDHPKAGFLNRGSREMSLGVPREIVIEKKQTSFLNFARRAPRDASARSDGQRPSSPVSLEVFQTRMAGAVGPCSFG